MTEEHGTERFEIHSDAESIEPSAEHDGTNLTRFVLAGAARRGVLEDSAELAAFGFGDRARDTAGSRTVSALIDDELTLRNDRTRGDRVGGTVRAAFDESKFGAALQQEEARDLIDRYGQSWDAAAARRAEWSRLNDGVDAYFAFLVAGLCSPRERESIAAAVAIANTTGQRAQFLTHPTDTGLTQDAAPDGDSSALDWDASSWQGFSTFRIAAALRRGAPRIVLAAVHELARIRIDLAVTSADALTRGLASAAFVEPSDDMPDAYTARAGGPERHVSTMVHGTGGYRGDWWEPQVGDLHGWVHRNHRPNLYAGNRPYSWSGALSRSQRAQAARRLKIWTASERGLHSVFAHSYGAEVVARTVNLGTHIDEVVMMSAPITQHHDGMLTSVRRVIDVRLRVDPVIALANIADPRVRHRFTGANVTPFLLPLGYLDHRASHCPSVWEDLKIAAQVGL